MNGRLYILRLAWLQQHASPRTELHVENTICCMKTLKASQRADPILSRLVPGVALLCGFTLRRKVFLKKRGGYLYDCGHNVSRCCVTAQYSELQVLRKASPPCSPRMICNSQSLETSWKIYECEEVLGCWCCWAGHCHPHVPVSAARAQGREAWEPLCSRLQGSHGVCPCSLLAGLPMLE